MNNTIKICSLMNNYIITHYLSKVASDPLYQFLLLTFIGDLVFLPLAGDSFRLPVIIKI